MAKTEKKAAGAVSVKKSVSFTFKKETPGAVCFQEVVPGNANPGADDVVIGTLYVRKAALGGVIPKSVSVEVTFSA